MAEQYLASARAALDADHEAGSALGQKGRRFQVEQIALDLSRFYWARYNWQETQGLDRGAEMAAAIKRATVTCHRLHQEFQELEVKYRDLRPPTAVNYVTNVAQIAVAYASLGAAVPSLPSGYDPAEHLGDVICVLTELTVEGSTATTTADAGQRAVSRSYLMKVYLVASRVLTGQSVSRREISSLFTDEHMRDHAVTKYDRARFEDLKKFCLERV